MLKKNNPHGTRLLAILVAVPLAVLLVVYAGRSADAEVPLSEAVSNLRASLLSDNPKEARAFWLTGKGTMMGMEMTAAFRFDGEGRFLLEARGPVAFLSGFDGEQAWRQEPSGATRLLQGGNAHYARIPHWMITGFWIDEAAPLTIASSSRKTGRNEMALQIQVTGPPLDVDVIVDTETWLPKMLVAEDYGMEFQLSVLSWERVGDRSLPKELFIMEGPTETGRFAFETFRSLEGGESTSYGPPQNNVTLQFDPNQSPEVEAKRGRWGHHFVKLRLNGNHEGWLAFDTGASWSMLDKGLAQKIGAEMFGETQSVGVGGTAQSELAKIASVQLGPVHIEDLVVTVRDIGNLSLGFSENRGLLGMDLIRHCVIVYDQANSTIEIHDPTTYKLPTGGEWQPLLDHNSSPLVAMPFEGHDGLFSIDTGNPGGILMGYQTMMDKGLLEGRETRTISVGGIGGSVPGERGRLDWVEWGGQRFENVPADFITVNKGAGADRSRDGIIGTDLLRRFVVVFDMTHGRIAYLPH